MSRRQVRPGRFPLQCLEIERPPERHGDVYDQGACECLLCQEWLNRLWGYKLAAAEAQGHSRSCMCPACDAARTASIALLVAENIRDLWSELSWTAQEFAWEPAWMDWFYEELELPSRSPGWWASRVTHLPMGYWYLRWERWKKAKA